MLLLEFLITILLIVNLTIAALFGVFGIRTGKSILDSHLLILVDTLARYSRLIFVVLTFFILSTWTVLSGISNHAVLSLDILFLLNSFLLVRLNCWKVPSLFPLNALLQPIQAQ